MRINARLDEDSEKKLEYLAKKYQYSQSDLIRAAINALYDLTRKNSAPACGSLLQSGFVGGGSAESDLSDTYKQYLLEGLSKKHDHR